MSAAGPWRAQRSTTVVDAAALLARLPVPPRRLTADSRQVRAGDAFAAYPGQVSDGSAFIPDAIARGAGAVLWEALSFRWDAAWRVSNVAVDDLKAKLGAHRRPHLRPPVARALRRRRHRDQRQDIVHALDRAMPRGLRPEERDPRHARQRPGRRARCRRRARRRTRQRSTRRSPACATRAPRPSRWKSRRTASSRGASTQSSSTSRCSRT